jgi:hypothetical protein
MVPFDDSVAPNIALYKLRANAWLLVRGPLLAICWTVKKTEIATTSNNEIARRVFRLDFMDLELDRRKGCAANQKRSVKYLSNGTHILTEHAQSSRSIEMLNG